MLYTVIEEDPQYATWIRYQLLERELLPELIIRITVTFCNDEVITHFFPLLLITSYQIINMLSLTNEAIIIK